MLADKAKHWLTQPLVSPVPIEKSAEFEMDGREDFPNLLCLWAAALKQNLIAERLTVTPWILQSGYYLQATAEASAEAAYPVPPRRAHDTLQPQDESIIVGYYTSAEVLP